MKKFFYMPKIYKKQKNTPVFSAWNLHFLLYAVKGAINIKIYSSYKKMTRDVDIMCLYRISARGCIVI